MQAIIYMSVNIQHCHSTQILTRSRWSILSSARLNKQLSTYLVFSGCIFFSDYCWSVRLLWSLNLQNLVVATSQLSRVECLYTYGLIIETLLLHQLEKFVQQR